MKPWHELTPEQRAEIKSLVAWMMKRRICKTDSPHFWDAVAEIGDEYLQLTKQKGDDA